MRTLLDDLRFGWRIATRSPGFTLVAVLTLAVGIAANSAVFGWIDSVLLNPIPGIAAQDQVYSLETRTPNGEFIPVSYPDFRDLRDHAPLFQSLTVARPEAFRLGEADSATRVWGELVSGRYFDILGVKPLLGRTFNAEEAAEKLGAAPVAVLSEALWRRQYQANPALIGQTIRLNGQKLTVIGITPAEFHGSLPGVKLEIWTPLSMAFALNVMPDWMLNDRGTRNLFALIRLPAGKTLPQVQAEAASASLALEAANSAQNKGLQLAVMPVWQGHFGAQNGLRDPLRLLMVVGAVVLLIVCANVANLLLARAAAREKEFSLRLALGARRGRLIRQLMTECLLLAAASAVLALPLIDWLRRSLGYLLPSSMIPIDIDIRQDWQVFAFTAAVSLLACVLANLAPAWHTAHCDLNPVLNEGGRSGSGGRRSSRLRSLLVGAEVALALVTLVGAGLFLRSFQLAAATDPGFQTKSISVAHLGLATAGYSVKDRILFCEKLAARLSAAPGIQAAAYADTIPMSISGYSWEHLDVAGYQPGPGENMKIGRNVVGPGYFETLGIPLRAGRDFNALDTRESEQVFIVNESFAKRFFPNRQVLGAKVKGWGRWFTIVGVAADAKYNSQAEAPKPYFYVPFRQVFRADLSASILVKAQGGEVAALDALRREARALDSNVSLYDTMPLADYISVALLPQRVAAALLAVLGTIALLLAGVGLYGVMSYSMSQRTREFGIRLAMGAPASRLLSMVLWQGLKLTLAGVAAGAAIAAMVLPLAKSLLVKVSALDPWIYLGSIVFLIAIGLLAAYLPARRAMRIDPNQALRCD